MAHRKAGGTAKNLRDSNPKYLGVKIYHGESAKPGAIIIRQRGTKFTAGRNVKIGKDHTLFAVKTGFVRFNAKNKTGFDGRRKKITVVNVI